MGAGAGETITFISEEGGDVMMVVVVVVVVERGVNCGDDGNLVDVDGGDDDGARCEGW